MKKEAFFGISDPRNKTLWYSYDAGGRLLSTYEQVADGEIVQREMPLYGIGRLGMATSATVRANSSDADIAVVDNGLYTRVVDMKLYELLDHLGNVRVVVSDVKLPDGSGSYKADMKSYSNYYPFGMQQPNRSWRIGEAYRFGYNGVESDNEIYGEGNLLATEFRMFDTRLGRWWGRDPIVKVWESPYAGMFNDPINYADPSGLSGVPVQHTPSDNGNAEGVSGGFVAEEIVVRAGTGKDGNTIEPVEAKSVPLSLSLTGGSTAIPLAAESATKGATIVEAVLSGITVTEVVAVAATVTIVAAGLTINPPTAHAPDINSIPPSVYGTPLPALPAPPIAHAVPDATATTLTIDKAEDGKRTKAAEKARELLKRPSNQPAIVYSLRVKTAGWYVSLTQARVVFLKEGDIWKYGKANDFGGRYKPNSFELQNFVSNTEYTGTEPDALAVEKMLILSYIIKSENVHRPANQGGMLLVPPGNRIYR